jgi:hypothetical protein
MHHQDFEIRREPTLEVTNKFFCRVGAVKKGQKPVDPLSCLTLPFLQIGARSLVEAPAECFVDLGLSGILPLINRLRHGSNMPMIIPSANWINSLQMFILQFVIRMISFEKLLK